VSVERDPRRVDGREGDGERQPERRHASIADPDEERHSADDTIGIGRGERMPEASRILGEARECSG
jgi:hypothetical protein